VDILLVNWQDLENPLAGGAEIHLFELFSRLAARGHRVRLVCSGFPGAAPAATVQGIEVTRVGSRYGFALHGRAAVRAAIAARRPDVIVEDINKVPLYLPSLAAGIPFCALVPHLFGATAFLELPAPLAAVVWASERGIPRGYAGAGFHAISESTRDDLVRRGIGADRIRVIHPGVDTGYFTPDDGASRSANPTFLYVGRLMRYKGVETAIRALAQARRTRHDLRLDIAGSGPHRPALERLVATLGLTDAVTFRGRVSETEKRGLLRSTWANVLPSAKEGWGITVMEAAACGTPSLASDRPGLRDSVRHGLTGWLLPHGDSDALAERMLELARDPAMVARLGRAARAHAETTTWDAAADATAAHLSDLIAHRT
jgi:glycosyltransferase involved in cell wall biosynthesis